MSEELFNLVFDGRLADGYTQAQVRQNLAQLFNLGDAQLATLFSGRPVILKKGLNKVQALKFRNALAQAGALGLVRPQGAGTTASSSEEVPQTPVSTPTRTPVPAPVPAVKADVTAAALAPEPALAPAPKAAAPAPAGTSPDSLTCPRCGHGQALAERCGACGMDLRLHLMRLEKRARILAARRI